MLIVICKFIQNPVMSEIILTENQFFENIFAKGQSNDSVRSAKIALATFTNYCKYAYSRTRTETLPILQDMKNPSESALRCLVSFNTWLMKDHKRSVGTARNYISTVRKWLKFCGGIKIDSEDMKDYVVFSPDDRNDEEAEPLTHAELKAIVMNFGSPKRKAMLMFMKCTASRTLESLRIKKGDFNFIVRPVSVEFRRSIVKGKTRKRVQFIDEETLELILPLVKDLEPEDFVFRKSLAITDTTERDNIIKNWNDQVKKLGFTAKYENGRLKKNIHSIRAFCMTQFEKATNRDLAHAYGGHRQYLDQYFRRSYSEKAADFEKAEKYLSIFTKYVFEK
tara:strand:- start:441 stop:1451 length:1011 start_codon:yes stop_codon:yes gene_type:complete